MAEDRQTPGWGDEVLVSDDAADWYRPGSRAWIVGLRLTPTEQATIEYPDGTRIVIPPSLLRQHEPVRSVRRRRPIIAARRALVTGLAFVLLMIGSLLLLPWFTSSETPSWGPFSHWLDLGWSPGTRNWGFLTLGLAIGVGICVAIVAVRPTRVGETVALVAVTGLLVVTLLEANAGLSVDPGPNLHADWGAVFGCAAVVFACCSVVLSLLME